jgi:hypothetical protein
MHLSQHAWQLFWLPEGVQTSSTSSMATMFLYIVRQFKQLVAFRPSTQFPCQAKALTEELQVKLDSAQREAETARAAAQEVQTALDECQIALQQESTAKVCRAEGLLLSRIHTRIYDCKQLVTQHPHELASRSLGLFH